MTKADEKITQIRHHLKACGVSLSETTEPPDVVGCLLCLKRLEDTHPDRTLLKNLRESSMVSSVGFGEIVQLAEALGRLYEKYPWAGLLVDDLETLQSLREAVRVRKELYKNLSRLGEGDLLADMKAVMSATTRVLIQSELSGNRGLLDVASFMLAEVASQLLNNQGDDLFLKQVKTVFLLQ